MIHLPFILMDLIFAALVNFFFPSLYEDKKTTVFHDDPPPPPPEPELSVDELYDQFAAVFFKDSKR